LSIAFSQDIPPELFQYNQSTFQAFYFFKNVMIDSNLVEADDWVGTFNCEKWDADSTACEKFGPCVGSRKWNTTKCGGGVCDLPAMGNAADGNPETSGYLQSGNYPVYLIYDNSAGVYYKTIPSGDVKLQADVCRNGYPFCYEWKNFGFYFVEYLEAKEIYLDCVGQIGGAKILDECGICGGGGPQFKCETTGISHCTEYQYQQECKSE
tara:strand:+ start:111 stop:737 length:627 start_codon:yes stop_codon:yes gene_type:complete